MKSNITYSSFLLFLSFLFGCKPVKPNLQAPDLNNILMEYLEMDLPIGRYILENKGSLGYIDTLSNFDVRIIRPEIPELAWGWLPCLIIQDLENGKCYSACRPVIYPSNFGGNSEKALNPIPGIEGVPDTIYYHRDHCSNLIALESFLNDKYGGTGIPDGFLQDFLDTYFKNFSGVESVSFEEMRELIEKELSDRKEHVQAYSWELASTLAKIKEAERISFVYEQFLYKNYGVYGIAIRVYGIPFSLPEERVKNPDAGPFQYRIAIDQI